MSASIPLGWEAIAREIASAVLDTGTEGFFTISIENDVYPDLIYKAPGTQTMRSGLRFLQLKMVQS